jgi:competence protein ComEC
MIDRGWRFYPALRVAVALSVGIIAARLLAPSLAQLIIVLYCAVGWLVVAAGSRGGFAIPLHIALVAAGAMLATLHPSGRFVAAEGATITDAEVIGRVAGEPVFRDGRIELLIEPESLLYRNSVLHPSGRVLVRLRDSTPFDPASIPAYGDHVSIAGTASVPSPPVNPGEIDYAAYLGSRGITLLLSTGHASSILIVGRGDLSIAERIVLPIRRAARAFAARWVGGEEGDIVRALLLGERDAIDPETRDAFTRTGTVHILAVSGFNVGLIALLLFSLVSWMPGRAAQFIIFTLLIGLYVMVAGAEASLLRAAVMAIAFMLARVTSRVSRPLNTLGVAATAILFAAPDQLFDIGFQLSFASVAGIIMLYEPGDRWMIARIAWLRRHPAPRWVARMLLLSLAAQLFTLPLVLHHFGYVSMISLILNLPVVPLTSVALGAGVAGSVAGGIPGPLAGWFGGASWMALALARWLVALGADLSSAGIEPGTIGVAGMLAIMAAVLRLGLGRRPAQTIVRALTVASVVIAVLLADRLADPLRAGSPMLFLLSTWRGTVAATVAADTVTLYAASARDSASLLNSGAALRRRVGGSAVRLLRLDTLADPPPPGLLLLNDAPWEYALVDPPVILSNTAQCRLSIVTAFGARQLRVPLGEDGDRALAFVYRSGWREIEW